MHPRLGLRPSTNACHQVTNWRLLPHVLMTILALTPAQTLGSYAPSLVVSFGFDRLKSNAMLSIGSWLSILTNIGWGWTADKLNRRGPIVLVGVTILWALIVRYSFATSTTSEPADQIMRTDCKLPDHLFEGWKLEVRCPCVSRRVSSALA